VVLDAEDIPSDVMQRIAKEMNISETTFVLPPRDPQPPRACESSRLRARLPFAGHPTVGRPGSWRRGPGPRWRHGVRSRGRIGAVPVRGVKARAA